MVIVWIIGAALAVAAQEQPVLPQTESRAAVEKQETSPVQPADPAAPPSVSLSAGQESSSSKPVRWLVSEPWCQYCPAAKKRFLDTGGLEENVITIKQAKELHGKTIRGVPAEYWTTETVTESSVIAVSEQAAGLPAELLIASALAAHLEQYANKSEAVSEGLFEIRKEASEAVRSGIAAIMRGDNAELPALGLTASWVSSKRAVTLTKNDVRFSPAVSISYSLGMVSAKASLSGMTIADGAESVTLLLDYVPDLTVRLK